jgi:hypothetical protein
MNPDLQLSHLEEADGHIARGKFLIAAQEELIERLRRNGHDTTLAEILLDNLEIAQKNHITHRELILRE